MSNSFDSDGYDGGSPPAAAPPAEAAAAAAAAAAATVNTDQTREMRKRIFKAGIASYQNHSLTANCVIRDINDQGAKLRFEKGAFVPEKFTLSIPVDSKRVDCEVRWRNGLEMGVTFVSAIERDTRIGRKQSVDVQYVVPRKSSLRKQPD